MKRTMSVIITICLVCSLTGCDALQRKFTRKKKQTKMPRIYQVKKYEKKPSPELYKKHFAYWTSWSSELIKVLGQNQKKDKRCIEEIVGNLRDMQAILVPEKASVMEPHIQKMAGVKDIIFSQNLTQANKDTVLRTIEREDRYIKREFHYDRVKKYLRTNFDDEEEQGA